MTNRVFSNLPLSLLIISVLFIPLFVSPFTIEFFLFPKTNFFIFITLLTFLFWFLGQTLKKRFEIRKNPFIYPLFLIFLVNLFSLLVNYQNLEKTTGVWTSLPFLVFPLYCFLLASVFDRKIFLIKNLFLISAVIISGAGIYFFLLPPSAYPLNLQITGFPITLPNSAISPTGNSLFSLIFLLSLIPFLINNFSGYFSEKEIQKKVFFLKVILNSLVTLVIITGIGIFAFQVFSLNKPLLLPPQFGWSVTIEAFKNPLTALLGTGPGSFLTAFTRFKPTSFNLFNSWGVRFSSSSNEVLQVLTTLGLAGLATYLYLVSRIIRSTPKGPSFYATLIILISLVFLPSNFFLNFLLVTYLALVSIETSEKSSLKIYSLSKQSSFLVGGGILIGFIFFGYLLGRNLTAEVYLRKSLIAATNNLASDTYKLQGLAIKNNPYRSDLHQVRSQTDLIIANAIAGNQNPSDQDKQTITKLIQEAITEARNGVVLAPLDITAWENLSSVYYQLINFAQGADNWAIATSQQTLKLDPNNPQQYLNLGRLYYSLGKIDEAISLFQTSITLKPDFTLGFYNLSAAYKEKKDFPLAYEALNQTVKFLPINSTDYQKVQKELEELKQKLPKSIVTKKPTPSESILKLPELFPSPEPQTTLIELPPLEKNSEVLE